MNDQSLSAFDNVQEASRKLASNGISNAAHEAKWLMEFCLGMASIDFHSQRIILSQDQREDFEKYLSRRLNNEPLAYITGQTEFWSLPFKVSPATLIPRADSETLVEQVLLLLPPAQEKTILELGTGSGCLLLSVLHERPEVKGIAVDISPEALSVAKDNAESLGLVSRTTFVESDWFASLPSKAARFHGVLSNPPYIPKQDIAHLMEDVRRYEPLLALDGGVDGLEAYRHIIAKTPHYLIADGFLAFEVGQGQADDVMALMHRGGFYNINKYKDLSGIDRVVLGFFAGNDKRGL